MTLLQDHLPFTSSSGTTSSLPANGSHVLVTDTITSPAGFVLYHLVSAALSEKRKVIWVDFRQEGRSSWESIFKKLGLPLPPSSSTQFIHISPTSFPDHESNAPQLFDDTHRPDLKPLYYALTPHLQTGSNGPLLLLDGLAELLFMGHGTISIHRFIRALLSLIRKSNGILLSSLHADQLPLTSSSSQAISSPEQNLLELLLQLGGGVWFRASGLASGRSGDVHGEISSHPLISPLTWDKPPDLSREKPLQYRLEAGTVKVFVKGTGRGFL